MNVLAVSGSLPSTSSNTALLHALASADGDHLMTLHPSIGALPFFSPEISVADAGDAVASLRAAIGSADGVVIASPEYAHSLPGVLKNALDWIVRSGELYVKPVVILCATPRIGGGALGRGAIEQTLRAQGANIVLSESVLIRKASSLEDELASAETQALFERVLEALASAISGDGG